MSQVRQYGLVCVVVLRAFMSGADIMLVFEVVKLAVLSIYARLYSIQCGHMSGQIYDLSVHTQE